MVVKIKEYYKLEIDKAKEITVKEDYSLKSPYMFIGLYFLSIFYNLIQISEGIYFPVIMLYTLPIILGTIYELYKIGQYKRKKIESGTIKSVLELGLIRITNILFFLLTAIIMSIQLISPEVFGRLGYVEPMNILLISTYFISFIMIAGMFLLGMVLEKRQVLQHKKKWFAPTSIIGSLSVLGYFILKNSSYFVFVLCSALGIVLLAYLIGRAYFRYRNFDKNISGSDKMINYKL